MSEYTSTQEGFQSAMKWALTGPADEAKKYSDATTMPNFYQLVNDQRLDRQTYVDHIAQWRGRTSDYEPVVDKFLRDGDQLAAHMLGTIKVDGVLTKFESFMFAKVDEKSGKLEWLLERSIWGPADAAPVV